MLTVWSNKINIYSNIIQTEETQPVLEDGESDDDEYEDIEEEEDDEEDDDDPIFLNTKEFFEKFEKIKEEIGAFKLFLNQQ